jgi:hypothetical protein
MTIEQAAVKRYGLFMMAVLISITANAHALLTISIHGNTSGKIVSILLNIMALLMALAMHELGHVITGLAQGFRFELFVVGLLGVKRTDKGIKIYLNKDVGMMGGVAATIPITQSPANRKKFAYMILGGPVSSLLFGLIALAISGMSTSKTGHVFWMVAGACSLALVLATTLPRKTGSFFTDRARFQRLMSKGKAGAVEEALLSIMAQYSIDNSSKNVNMQQVQLLQTDDEESMRFWGFYYEYQYYKDNALTTEAVLAKEKLMAVKSYVSSSVWKMLKIDDVAAA